ncbi:zinc finger domain-containing protein [Feifania hominis]|uniref:Com family DNA-binding transcriptional regulator n=1 Tax=Feifania hominis TaxID=2763660 RepID=A0A926DFI0_9FIRM|nr:Com family DNA-binding transcriptional regulator [Feifania hominis]
MLEIRCEHCGRLLGFFLGRAQIKCPRCKRINTIDTERQRAPVAAR